MEESLESTRFQERKGETYSANVATFKGWVEDCSGGFLTADADGIQVDGWVVIRRSDGKPWYTDTSWPGTDDKPSIVTGYLIRPYLSQYAKLTRRNKRDVKAAFMAVRHILCDLHRREDPDLPSDWAVRLDSFVQRNHLGRA